MSRYEIVETVDGKFIVLVDGLQWGRGPRDRSGASSQTWKTQNDAKHAIASRAEIVAAATEAGIALVPGTYSDGPAPRLGSTMIRRS